VGEYKIQYYNEQDGFTYCWDKKREKWVKLCVVNKLPDSIAQQVQRDIDNAEELLSVKL